MRVSLLFSDRDYPWETPEPEDWGAKAEDLQLQALLDATENPDCRLVLSHPLHDPEQIRYRQQILEDLMAHPQFFSALLEPVRSLDAHRAEIRQLELLADAPAAAIRTACRKMAWYLRTLEQLADTARQLQPRAPGLQALLKRLAETLDADFFREAETCLRQCRFKNGVRFYAGPEDGLRITCRIPEAPDAAGIREFFKSLLPREDSFSFTVDEQDFNGMKALSALEDGYLQQVSGVLSRAAAGMEQFFVQLARELGFYAGCCRLITSLKQLGIPLSFPGFGPVLRGKGICSGSLSITLGRPAVASDLEGRNCILITGAHQGGKTAFLRALGQAMVLGRGGLPVCAASLEMPPYPAVFTHFRQEEDRSLHSGKLEEELLRMERIVRAAKPGDCLLMNESFASTNESDGAELGWQVMTALLDNGIRVICVTHFYDLARRFLTRQEHTRFLAAGRLADGTRTYRMEPEPPRSQSHALDLYRKIFDP